MELRPAELYADKSYQSRYILKTSCGKEHTPKCCIIRRCSEKKQNFAMESLSCYDKFALAKRLHAENLKHQPLPDRVDDSVFKNVRITHELAIDCNDQANISKRENFFEPVLGCKKPETRMDLAICWETPINPIYEPQRSKHIDGTEGGSAPAIFALIQHTPVPRDRQVLSIKKHSCDCMGEQKMRDPCKCCECLCKRMKSVAVAEQSRDKSRSNSLPRVIERKSIYEPRLEKKYRDPRLTRSAVGIALGLEEKRNVLHRGKLSTNIMVPRPRTPFARRSFCIDTLAPPFSVTRGYRDADYPEHWRLMSIYQQSYKNPQKRKTHHF